jgi:hypothetical protein
VARVLDFFDIPAKPMVVEVTTPTLSFLCSYFYMARWSASFKIFDDGSITMRLLDDCDFEHVKTLPAVSTEGPFNA